MFFALNKDRDGEPEVLLLRFRQGYGSLFHRTSQQEWEQAGRWYHKTSDSTASVSIERALPVWDDLVINGERMTLTPP